MQFCIQNFQMSFCDIKATARGLVGLQFCCLCHGDKSCSLLFLGLTHLFGNVPPIPPTWELLDCSTVVHVWSCTTFSAPTMTFVSRFLSKNAIGPEKTMTTTQWKKKHIGSSHWGFSTKLETKAWWFTNREIGQIGVAGPWRWQIGQPTMHGEIIYIMQYLMEPIISGPISKNKSSFGIPMQEHSLNQSFLCAQDILVSILVENPHFEHPLCLVCFYCCRWWGIFGIWVEISEEQEKMLLNIVSLTDLQVAWSLARSSYDPLKMVYRAKGQGLTEIPSDIPAQTEQLELQRNNITSIPAGALSNLSHLKRLRLDSLIYLDLASNKFKNIPDSVFSSLPQLENLYLSANQISQLSDEQFLGLDSLRYLNLMGNPLGSIPLETFSLVCSWGK